LKIDFKVTPEDMNVSVGYRIHVLCAATAVFVIFIILYVVRATWRFPQFRLQTEATPSSPHLKPICSFNVFRDIARSREDGFVSGNGTWKRNGHGVPEHFEPDVCRFRHRIHIPRQEVLQCIKRLKLHYVVFAGDSNSRKYYSAFSSFLAGVGAQCSQIQVTISYESLFV